MNVMYREPQRRAGIEISRVGEVLVTLTPGSPGRRASGYRVSAGLVLTAAHALRQASKVRIRFDAAQPGEWVAPVTHIVEFPEIDIAVLSIDPHDHNQVEPVRFGRIAERDAVIECSMVGFPRFKIKRGPSQPLDGGPFLYRDSCHAMGTVAVYSNRKQGTLEVSVLAPERDPDPNVSPWEGMSGAAVFAAGRIVGVITEHNRAEGLGKLTASRVDRWYDKLTPKRLDQLREMLKIPEERNQLGDVVPPRAGEIVEARYLAQARDNAPAQLLGRDDELAELAAFCAGTENYQWWQGPPGAGKTALAAWFVLHPPAGVRVVSFFVTRRLPGQADSSAFTAALIEQLAAAADEAIAEPASRAGRDHERRRLLDRAAARMRECGMRLLLVIDGLDEDIGTYPGSGITSIASLLPKHLPGGVKVLVTSRPHPPIRVDRDHPLHPLQLTPRPLSPSPYAGDIMLAAENELLQHLHSGKTLRIDLIGYLAASGGGLTRSELAALTGSPSYVVGAELEGTFGRSVQARIAPDSPPEHPDLVYLFAHETMADVAADQLGDDLSTYRRKIYQWAAKYQRRRWPPDTPRFLLRRYGSLLAEIGEFKRLSSLAIDRTHRDRLLDQTGWRPPGDPARGIPRYLRDTRPSTAAEESQGLLRLVTDEGWIDTAIQAVGVDPVLADLRRAAASAPDDETVEAMLSAVRGQAHHLRLPQEVPDVGYVSRQLCFQAAELGEDALAADFRKRLLALDTPGLVPRWTSRKENLALLAELGSHDGAVYAVAVLGDGQIVSAGEDGRVRVWKTAAPGDPAIELGRHDGAALTVAALAEGRAVSGGEDRRVLVWNTKAPGQPAVELGRHDGAALTVAALADGRVISGGEDGQVAVWNTKAPSSPPVELGRHGGGVHGVAALADGRVLSAGEDGWLQVWDLAEQSNSSVKLGHHKLGRHNGAALAVAVLADGRVLSAGEDGGLQVWDLTKPTVGSVERGRHGGGVHGVAELADGRVLSAGEDGWLQVWDLAEPDDGSVELGRHDGAALAVAELPDGPIVSGGADGRVLMWDPAVLRRGSVQRWCYGGAVHTVAMLADGRVVSGGTDGRVQVWNPAVPDDPPIELGCHGGGVSAVAVLDGRVVSAGSDGLLWMWNLTEREGGPVELGPYYGAALAILPDGLLVTGGYDRRVLKWNTKAPGQLPVELGHHDSTVTALAVTPDEHVVSAAADGSLWEWSPAKPGHPLVRIGRHDHGANAIAVARDRRLFSGGDDGYVREWDLAKPGDPAVELGRHNGWVNAIAALPGGQVATGGTDGRVRVWGVRTGRKAQIRKVHGLVACSVHALAAGATRNSDGLLAVAHVDGQLSIWSIAGAICRT